VRGELQHVGSSDEETTSDRVREEVHRALAALPPTRPAHPATGPRSPRAGYDPKPTRCSWRSVRTYRTC
jgi:hypothetical protein